MNGILQTYALSQTSPYNPSSTVMLLLSGSQAFQGQISYPNTYIFSTNSPLNLSNIQIRSDIPTCLQERSSVPINPLYLESNMSSNQPLNISELLSFYSSSQDLPQSLFNLTEYYIKPTYTIFLYAEQFLNVLSTHITGARIGLFAQSIQIDEISTVDTTGKGCSLGLGQGFVNNEIARFCAGSGGSYGGLGGPGESRLTSHSQQFVCDELLGRPFGNKNFPYFEGSGGGDANSSLNRGSGGGVIILGAKTCLLDGRLISGGFFGNISKDSDNTIAGSGSGGSIQIHTVKRLRGTGAVSAEGASHTQQGGGFGKFFCV